MKKAFGISGILLLLLLFIVTAGHATAILWQVGEADGSPAELSLLTDPFVYDFGFVDPLLATAQTNDGPLILGGSYSPSMDISFEIGWNYDFLHLNYGRAGAEINDIFLDGNLITSVTGPGEGIWQDFSLTLLDVDRGVHTLTIAYAGGAPDNGHAIDFVQLVNGQLSDIQSVPEPATMFLLGAGLLGIGMIGRRFKK